MKTEQEIYNEIVVKARNSEDFRRELESDPKKTVQAYVSKNLDLRELESLLESHESNLLSVAVGVSGSDQSVELTEDQLSNVSGGVMEYLPKKAQEYIAKKIADFVVKKLLE